MVRRGHLVDDGRQRGGRGVSRVDPVEDQREQHLGVGVAADLGEPARRDLRPELLLEPVAEAVPPRRSTRTTSGPDDERCIAGLDERRPR